MADSCVFCDLTQFEERIIAETDNFYVIASLGQITDGGYVLLFPKRHVPCLLAMEEDEIKALSQLRMKVLEVLWKEYKDSYPCIEFEHGIVGQTIKHAHLHIVPTSECSHGVNSLRSWVEKDFPEEFNRGRSVISFLVAKEVYTENNKPYLLWRDEDPRLLICSDPQAPLQYFRTVVAEAMGRPERANWRNMDQELDKKLWQETVQRLRPYFK